MTVSPLLPRQRGGNDLHQTLQRKLASGLHLEQRHKQLLPLDTTAPLVVIVLGEVRDAVVVDGAGLKVGKLLGERDDGGEGGRLVFVANLERDALSAI